METIKNYIETHKERFLEELFELIRIPSISAKAEAKEDMLKTAAFIKKALLDAGADLAEVKETKGWPVVYGEKIIDPNLPTILVYGHYDVQPADPYELWDSPPFEPEVRDGKIYARGADDDKGQMFMHVKAFELMNKTNTLTCNVKFMIEGEEEIGSPSLKQFCKDNKEMSNSS
jgi:acetylornithine deacetylase/succinyl-diaminopimelate desuccinylase-like protein